VSWFGVGVREVLPETGDIYPAEEVWTYVKDAWHVGESNVKRKEGPGEEKVAYERHYVVVLREAIVHRVDNGHVVTLDQYSFGGERVAPYPARDHYSKQLAPGDWQAPVGSIEGRGPPTIMVDHAHTRIACVGGN
jgi:hypothetical protein